ncbi:UDP-N-acetylmuramoyl-L-alanine--D-glutamate ligase [Campylobacter hepaticus]|uniref:UDP-N-acetylmuramoyl-L-alanine--D-glutamate ligase n=1 Tax=Campylobacter hepaticus TaxID=1813019 RepID=UPI0029A2A934|nr:UDP-N-acetylmuramoyl-L-alanine--D-glutamate ligase [Campylobacter hepaticus]MDX2323788.1 UDP-N-acetylmuramoyl-L-alanine--D-glutamate ligase [Campylobacter hepaticus]MDX2333117.1 UDP-N-acetylmuramoyl-L-alanine--D-glutamate ligase [Campylobacter hepaticus]MDX2410038.1 UDP-N-acetylmuramoyl-L-alanine--D-glutamate ligase [Campylobacter hepaticus]
MKISLFGYGKTTRAIAQNLTKQFGTFNIYDDHFKKASKDVWGNKLLNPKDFNENTSKLEIPSPGFPPNHTLIKQAKNLQSEYDFFYDAMPKSVWISGTNGKTTTTQMSAHLLSRIGALAGGNIGTPLAQLNAQAKLWILETSSFTLHYTRIAKPEIYVLLPIHPDHLSWHGNFQNYIEAKLSVLQRMNECDVAILPKPYANTPTKAHIISYENEEELAKKFHIKTENIPFKSPFLLDAIMALSIEKILLDTLSYELLNHFILEENKLEELKDSQNRLWVNDTKATNESAAMAALNRYKDKKIHLIIGGDDKGVNLSDLFCFMKNLNIELYIIGASTQKMFDYARKINLKAHKCEILQKAVMEISKQLKIDEVALLSPACASLDQFSSYVQRGEVFKESIKQL